MTRKHRRSSGELWPHAGDRSGRVGDDRGDTMRTLLAATSSASASERRGAVPLATAFGHAQRTAGNAAVQRLVQGEALPVQRWKVALAPTASCNAVLDYIRTNSPYRPMAAYTKPKFSYDPTFEITGGKQKYSVTVSDANVELETSVDMPEWKPEGKMEVPWAKGVRELRNHEGEHENVAEKAKASITKTLEAMKMSVTAKNRAAAEKAARKLVKAKWITLLRAHNKAQKKLDPYYVNIKCPKP